MEEGMGGIFSGGHSSEGCSAGGREMGCVGRGGEFGDRSVARAVSSVMARAAWWRWW